MAGVFPMDDVVLDGVETMNGHDNFSDDDCIEVRPGDTTLFIMRMRMFFRLTPVSMRRVQTSQLSTRRS